jgi:Fe-S-cluster containining protein
MESIAQFDTVIKPEIDNAFHTAVMAPTKCENCGLCCSVYDIGLSEADLEREPKLKDCSRKINDHYSYLTKLMPEHTRMIAKETHEGCQFHIDGKCSIHATKPDLCSGFPSNAFSCWAAKLAEYDFPFHSWVEDTGNFIKNFIPSKLCTVIARHEDADITVFYLLYLLIPFMIDLDKLKKIRAKTDFDIKGTTQLYTLIDTYDLINPDAKIPDVVRNMLNLTPNYKNVGILLSNPPYVGFQSK